MIISRICLGIKLKKKTEDILFKVQNREFVHAKTTFQIPCWFTNHMQEILHVQKNAAVVAWLDASVPIGESHLEYSFDNLKVETILDPSSSEDNAID